MSDRGIFHGTQIRPVLLLPFVLYAAARLTPRATTIVMVAFAAVVLFVTKNGQRPFGDLPIAETVLQAQQFVLIMNVTALGLAALLSQLRSNARDLEMRVQDRTMELRAANEQLQRLAVADPLTGVLNRRALFDLIGREMERDLRHHHGLSVIMFDIDHFKDVNDRHGHPAGDIVLRHVATVTAQAIRSTDALARYGGEEFVIIAPDTDQTHALHLAERVREALQSSDVSVSQQRLRVTASFGVAMLRADDKEPEQLLGRADTALYAAKAEGRNRVVVEATLPVSA
jgi:diguanylate cyclase (GGDEF)-like protein